jgi:hypothetical protein
LSTPVASTAHDLEMVAKLARLREETRLDIRMWLRQDELTDAVTDDTTADTVLANQLLDLARCAHRLGVTADRLTVRLKATAGHVAELVELAADGDL